MGSGQLPKNVYFIETDLAPKKWGMDIRPLLVSEKALHIGRWHNSYRAGDYLKDPRVWLALSTARLGLLYRPETAAGLWADEYDQLESGQYDEVRFEDIRSFSLMDLPHGEKAVDIIYRRGSEVGRLWFTVANQYARLPKDTLTLFDMLKERIGLISP